MESLAKERGLKYLTGQDDLNLWGRDWTHYFPVRSQGVIFPKTVEDIAEILKHCSSRGIRVVPSGGRTGLVAGAYATQGELVLSLSAMNRILDWDPLGLTVQVQAGVVQESLQEFLKPKGFHWPVDLAAKGSCQIGGNLATNAGGIHVIKYGMTRRWVQSLTVVLASGEVLELNGPLEKNNTGPCLRDLIIGSEGTLAVIAEARLKVAILPRERLTLFTPVAGPSEAMALLKSLRESGCPLLAFEYMDGRSLNLVLRHRGHAHPFPGLNSDVILMEVELKDVSELSPSIPLHPATVLAESETVRNRFWDYREVITEAMDSIGFVYKHDVSLSPKDIPSFLGQIEAQFSAKFPGALLLVFGHFGDGNLHLNFAYPQRDSGGELLKHCEAANEWLFSLVRDYKGSISAEHGIGLLKRAYVEMTKSAEELRILRAIKKSMDPQGILNPGKGVV